MRGDGGVNGRVEGWGLEREIGWAGKQVNGWGLQERVEG